MKRSSKIQKTIFLVIIFMNYIAFGMEMDLYVPSLPNMLAYFSNSEGELQFILSANFFGLCLAGLIWGPLSDSFGRKGMLSIGLLIFTVSSFLCVYSKTLEMLIAARFLQGIGSAAPLVITLALVFDVFNEEKAAKIIGILNSVITFILAVAPFIGMGVNIIWGWRANFLIIAIFSLITWFITMIYMKETLTDRKQRFSLISILKTYGILLTNKTYLSNILILSALYSCLVIYIANLSFIFINYLNVNEAMYTFYQSVIMVCFGICSLLGSRLISKIGMSKVCSLGFASFLIGASVLLLSSYYYSLPIVITISMLFISSGIAFSIGIYGAKAFSSVNNIIGAASSFANSSRLLILSLVIYVSSQYFNGSMLPIAWSIFFLAIFVITINIFQYFFIQSKLRVVTQNS